MTVSGFDEEGGRGREDSTSGIGSATQHITAQHSTAVEGTVVDKQRRRRTREQHGVYIAKTRGEGKVQRKMAYNRE